MKNLLLLPIILCLISCKQTEKKTETTETTETLTVAQKIANAHGFEHWDNVTSFEFTFGGKMEDPNSGRSWQWNPKTDDVRLIRNNDTVYYNRANMDSIAIKSDRAFINDKFWALIPFQLIWDESATISEPVKANAPISGTELNKIVLTYSNEGGYTPGDAYDIFYDDNFIIKEWNFRKGNAPEPSLTNTFENHQDFNGLKVALEHKKSEGDWNLLIRNVKVTLKD